MVKFVISPVIVFSSSLLPLLPRRFAVWFADYQWERWDSQLEKDVEAGKLDRLADEALADLDAGRTRPR
jgi:hypothetical protein